MKYEAVCCLALVCVLAVGCDESPGGPKKINRVNYGAPPTLPAAAAEDAPPTVILKARSVDAQGVPTNDDPLPAPPLQPFGGGKLAKPVAGQQGAAAKGDQPALSDNAVKARQGLRAARGRVAAWDYYGSLASAKRGTEETMDFNMLHHNMDLYKAEHNNKGPKSHDEYMRIVKNDWLIKLPDPPPGMRYIYDPKDEELYLDDEK